MRTGAMLLLCAATALAAVPAQAQQTDSLGLHSYLRSPYDPAPNPVLAKAIRQSGNCACAAPAPANKSAADEGPSDWEIAHDTAEAREILPVAIESPRRARAESVQIPP